MPSALLHPDTAPWDSLRIAMSIGQAPSYVSLHATALHRQLQAHLLLVGRLQQIDGPVAMFNPVRDLDSPAEV